MIILILAIDQDNLVGSTTSSNGLAWHYKEDLDFYKQTTTGKQTVMGYNTYKAIGGALPNRETFVLSHSQRELKDATLISSLQEVLDLQKNGDVYICGGVSVYKQFIDYADKILITRVNKSHKGDVYYHDLNLSHFNLRESRSSEDKILTWESWSNENCKD